MRKNRNSVPSSNLNASVHGTLVNVAGVGVLITGESGTGKSEIALKLVSNGHQLVADDVVEIVRSGNSVIGSAPPALNGILEIRGLGLIDVRALFGESSVIEQSRVDIFIELGNSADAVISIHSHVELLGIKIRRFVSNPNSGRDLTLLVKTAVGVFRDPHSLITAEQISTRLTAAR